jgi:hypothetical protein
MGNNVDVEVNYGTSRVDPGVGNVVFVLVSFAEVKVALLCVVRGVNLGHGVLYLQRGQFQTGTELDQRTGPAKSA